MRYEGTVYRPPSEAGSLLVQATLGCPHNQCLFCGMYKDKRFRIRPTAEVLGDLDEARTKLGAGIRSLFLPDGNSIIIKTRNLARILEHARENFPDLERITVYGSARFLALKSLEELKTLRRAGLSRIHLGLESGDDETLAAMKKGATSAETVAAGLKVREAGLELSAYYLVGLGGRVRLFEHALASARALSAMAPEFVRLRTYLPVPEAPLSRDILAGRFVLPSPFEALGELEILVTNLEAATLILSDHVSNHLNLTGRLPEDRPELLEEIQSARQKDERCDQRRLTRI
ncbi:MAG: radical SAM protein [Thermodesulfobacteriota bacterium]